MKSFEQQTADAIRVLTAVCIVLAVALVIVLGLACWGLLDSKSNASAVAREQRALKASVQSPTHGKDIATWCNAINASRDYTRQYTTGTLKQTESEAQTIDRAIAAPSAHGLTVSQATFIRLYLDSVVALEREAPQTLKLHPFTLGDLNCKAIEAGEAASSHAKK